MDQHPDAQHATYHRYYRYYVTALLRRGSRHSGGGYARQRYDDGTRSEQAE